MKILIRIISLAMLAMLVPTGAFADPKPKKVIITDSVPISVEVMNDVPVQVELAPGGVLSTVPVPTVAAEVKGFDKFFNDTTGGFAYVIVERDSILKYVNLSFRNLAYWYDKYLFETEGDKRADPYSCEVDVTLRNPNESRRKERLLARVQISGVKAAGGSRLLVVPPQLQFATGDILVPAGHMIMARVSDASQLCFGSLYGLLFEQD